MIADVNHIGIWPGTVEFVHPPVGLSQQTLGYQLWTAIYKNFNIKS